METGASSNPPPSQEYDGDNKTSNGNVVDATDGIIMMSHQPPKTHQPQVTVVQNQHAQAPIVAA